MAYCKDCRHRDKKCAFLKKKCELLLKNKDMFCYECEEFPCENLEHIDKHYQKFFHMSLKDHPKFIKEYGLAKFLKSQKKKYPVILAAVQRGLTLRG